MVKRCRFGHSHPPREVIAATNNPTKPWGPRPYHCPDCAHVNKPQAVRKNWVRYASSAIAIKNGHPFPCKQCFP